MLTEQERAELGALTAELRSLANARGNVNIMIDELAATTSGKIAAQAVLMPVWLKKVKQQGRWAAGDWAQATPDIGPTMAKIDAVLGRIEAREGASKPPVPPVPPTPPSGGASAMDVDTLAQLVMKLSKSVDELRQDVRNERLAAIAHQEHVEGK